MKKGSAFCRAVNKIRSKIAMALHRAFVEPLIKGSFASCGKKVRVGQRSSFSGIENISIGNHTSLGSDTRILTTRAKVKIGSYVMFGPGVTIVSGDHRIDVVGKYMSEIEDSDKRPEHDRDVVIEDDVWVGTGAIILKGVTVGSGSVIGAGALVTKDVQPYAIVGGVPAKVLKFRFEEGLIASHKALIAGRKD